MAWFGSSEHLEAMANAFLYGLGLLLCHALIPRHHHVPHRKLRAASARRGPAAGVLAPSMRPAAGSQLSREFWHQEWLAEHQRFTHRGSAVPSSVETLPAVGTETVSAAGQPRDAFPPLASRRGSVDPAIDVEPQPVAGGTHMTPATGDLLRTPVRSGSAAPRSCGPHPVVGADVASATGLSDRSSSRRGAVRSDPATGARSPVAGPKRQATSHTPDVASLAFQPRYGEATDSGPVEASAQVGDSLCTGSPGAVVPEATAPTRSAA